MPQTVKDEASRVEVDLSYIRYKIETQEYSLSFKKSFKSAIWQTFAQVIDACGEIVPNVVACSKCSKLYRFSSHRMGTSNLLKHGCLQDTNNRLNESVALAVMPAVHCDNKASSDSSHAPGKRKLPRLGNCSRNTLKFVKEQLLKNLVNLVTKDLYSPADLESGGLIDLMQFCIDIAASKQCSSRFYIKDIMPHSSVIMNAIRTSAAEQRQKLVTEIKQVLSTIGGSLSLEIWQDPVSKIEFLTITVHTMQKFKLINRILKTYEFDTDHRSSAENLMTCVYQTLKSYMLDDFFHRLVYVTDRNANISVALNGTTRLSCVPSALSALVDYTIQTENSTSNNDIFCLLASCTSLALHMRRAGLDLKLNERLDRPPETIEAVPWIKRFDLLLQIDSQWDKISDLLRERDEMQLLSGIHRETLHALLEFVTPFKEAIEELERKDKPTLYLVLVWYTRLVKEIQPTATDSMLLASLKSNARICLMQLEVHQLHRIALFLHPKLKSLKLLHDESLKLSVHAEVRSMVSAQVMTCYMEQQIQVANDARFNASSNGSSAAISTVTTPSKKSRSGALSDLEDSSDDDSAVFDVDEVNKYLQYKVAKTDGMIPPASSDGGAVSAEFNLLGWWETHEREFPRLSHVAQFVHSIPASHKGSAPEHRIEPNMMDDLLFLHSLAKSPNHSEIPFSVSTGK